MNTQERNQLVSVWIGNGTGREQFNSLLEYHISNEGLGNFEACEFCKSYGITSYDPDDFGGRYYPKALKPELLFNEVCNAEEIVCSAKQHENSNCYVLLYNQEYTGPIKEIELKGFKFSYLGSFRYSDQQ